MDAWIIAGAAPSQSAWHKLPALSAETGSRRLALASEAVGMPSALKAAREAGLYLLDDKLALKLKLIGIKLGAQGEIPALSPSRWKETEAESVPEDCVAVQLTAVQKKRLLSFLKKQHHAVPSPAALARIARHFFYEEAITIAVARNSSR